MMKLSIRNVRLLMTVVAISQIALAALFFTQQPVINSFWPFQYTSDLSFIFMASIALAAAASTLWCIVEREEAGFVGIALDYLLLFTPMVVLGLQVYSRSPRSSALNLVVAAGLTLLFGLWLLLWSRRLPFRDQQPTPRPVRFAFGFFVIALFIVGGAMILRTPNILPWTVSQEVALFYGWFFLGAAVYFIYGLVRPVWGNAGGQLAGFLAYDLVLIVPFLQHLSDVRPEHRVGLYIYIAVVVGSGLLAAYYLFINPSTRMGRRSPVVTSSAAVSEAGAA
jgi:hypothetical protein